MATSPFPFYLTSSPPSATYHQPFPFGFSPSYAPSPVFFPSPCGFGAPAPGFFPAPATFPCAATYPYPPSASAYTAYSPAQPYDTSTVPYASESSCPSSKATPIPTNVEPNWPPPAPDSTPSILFPAPTPGVSPFSSATSTSPSATASKMQAVPAPLRELHDPDSVSSSSRDRETSGHNLHARWSSTSHPSPRTTENSRAVYTGEKGTGTSGSVLHPATPDITCQGGDLTKENGAGDASISDEKLIHKHGSGLVSMANNDSNYSFASAPTVQAVAEERVPAKDAILPRLQRELRNIHARLDQLQARERTSLNSIQGELAKLKSMASALALAMGMQTTESPVTGSSPPLASAQFRSAATNASSFCDTGAAASLSASSLSSTVAASFVVSSSTFASVSATSATAVPSATAYVAPQVFGEMQTPNSGHGKHVIAPADENCCYGYANQIQSSCVQGGSTNLSEQYLDGLPDQYGFANLNRQSVFRADGTEHRYFTLPEDYPLEQATPPILPSEVENVGVTTKLSVVAQAADVQDFTLEQQPQDDEKTSVNVQQPRDSRCKVLVIHERRNEWDPGIHTILSSTPNRDIEGFIQTSILPRSGIFILNNVLAVRIQFGIPKCCVPQQCFCRVPSSQEQHGIQFLWDPGILNQMNMILDKSAVPNLLHSGQTKFMLSFLVGQPVGLKQFWSQMLLQYHSWYNIQSAFLQVPYFLPFVLDCPYSERVRQLVFYSCMYCMSSSTTLCMILNLSSGEIVQERRDVAAVYYVFRIQLPMSKTYHIWDPGIESILVFVHLAARTHDSASSMY